MNRFVRRRLLALLPTLFLIVTLTFLISRLAPGGPFHSGRAVPEAVRANIEARYGLDRPLGEQYLRFWVNLATGRLGPSFQQPEIPATRVIADGFGPSLAVGLTALLLALLIGLGGGSLAVLRPRAAPLISALALVCLALPVFVLGPLLIRFLAVELGLFPAALWGSPAHLVLPALTLGIPAGGALVRFWRPLLADRMSDPAALAARARGMSEFDVARRHAAPRALPVLLNYLGPLLAGLVTGSVVVETIFGLPGMGRYFVESALARDYPVVLGATLLYAVVLLVVHTGIDLVQIGLDPRLARQEEITGNGSHLRNRGTGYDRGSADA